MESVKYTITVKVFYINPSTGLGRWETLATLSGSTHQLAPYRIEGYLDTRDVELRKYHSWTLPSSGDYPARVRVEFSLSASGYVKPALTNGSAQAGGGALISASRKGGAGTVLPLAQLSVSSTPIPVTVSYSGAVSGSASTPFTLYGVGRDLTVTLTAPSSVTAGGKTYAFVKWRTSDGETTSTSVTITVTQGSSKWATAVYQEQSSPPPPSIVTLTLQLYRVDRNGNSLGPAAGAQVRIGGTTYTADSQGRVSVQVQRGSTVSVEVLQTTLSSGWQRYTFWRWGDGSTSNPRSFTVSSSTTVTAYVYDERLLKVTWSPGTAGYVAVNGQPVSNGWTNWYRYGAQLTLQAVPTSGAFKKWMRGVNGGQLADHSTANPITITVDNGYQYNALFDPTITLSLATMYLPGEGIATPWLENVTGWAWDGIWLLNVTELYRVNEHIVALLTDGTNVRVLDLPNGTSLKVYLPPGWKNNPFVRTIGQMKITQIPRDRDTLAKTFPSVNISDQTWFLVALAAWNPYKQFNEGYDTSCWLGNGTTLAVYNVTYTYTFQNGTRVVFKQPVVVSTLKVAATPVYTYGELRQGLSLKVTASWKYLPPARTGIQPSPPSSIVGVAVIGSMVYNGTLIEANATSKTFLVRITDNTWTLYGQGVTSITASAYWLSSMGTPEGPVALQEPARLNIVYVMPHIDAISEGLSLTATISVLDVKTGQRYGADVYIELRDNGTFALVASYGPFHVPGRAEVTISRANTKQYVLAIYAVPVHDPRSGRLVVPIAAVYPPRA